MVNNKKNYYVINIVNCGYIVGILDEIFIEIILCIINKGLILVYIGELLF